MSVNFMRGAGLVAISLGALAAPSGAAVLAVGASDPGAATVTYRGPRIQVAISDRYARYHPGGPWLLLDAEMGATGGVISIPRRAIAVRTPSGEVVPLATQREFEAGYPQLASAIVLANFHRTRLDYFLPECPRQMDLFRLHGVGWVLPSLVLDPFHNSYGRLYFHLPNGVQRGRYELLIGVPKGEAVIPFHV